MPALLKIEEASELLGISVIKLRRLTWSGVVPSIRFGRCCLRYSRDTLNALKDTLGDIPGKDPYYYNRIYGA